MSINWKSDKNGAYFTKVSNFRIEHTPHPVFEEMVTIVKGPSFGSHLFGKRYVSYGKAVIDWQVKLRKKNLWRIWQLEKN